MSKAIEYKFLSAYRTQHGGVEVAMTNPNLKSGRVDRMPLTRGEALQLIAALAKGMREHV